MPSNRTFKKQKKQTEKETSSSEQIIIVLDDSPSTSNATNDRRNRAATKPPKDDDLDIFRPQVSIYVETGVNTNTPRKMEKACQTQKIAIKAPRTKEKACQTMPLNAATYVEMACQTLDMNTATYVDMASQTLEMNASESVEMASQTLEMNASESVEVASQTLEMNASESLEVASQTLEMNASESVEVASQTLEMNASESVEIASPTSSKSNEAEVQQPETITPSRPSDQLNIRPKVNKWIWYFEIKSSKCRTYKFEEKYSSIKTVWDIKVRLHHLERVPIEPANQVLIYKTRFIKNNELLKNLIDEEDMIIKMHLADKRKRRKELIDEFKSLVLETLTDMGIDLEMAYIALEATDYNINDALDILQNI